MNAITKTDRAALPATQSSVAAIVPNSIEAVWRLSEIIVASGWSPQNMKSRESVAVAVMQGMEIGLKPMQAIQSIAVINGRPSIWGDAAIGLVQGSGLCEYVNEWIEGKGDAMIAFCEAKRMDSPKPVNQSFSVDDAKLAGLWGKAGPWKQYPKRMLQMRARSFALRDAFADVLKGLHVAEETRDYQPMRNVTPADRSRPDLAAELESQARTGAGDNEIVVDEGEDEFVPDDRAPDVQNHDEKVSDTPSQSTDDSPVQFYNPGDGKTYRVTIAKAEEKTQALANKLMTDGDISSLETFEAKNRGWLETRSVTTHTMLKAAIRELMG